MPAKETEIVPKEFYFNATDEADNRRFYSNTTGEYSVDNSEELEIDFEEFKGYLESFEMQCIDIKLTPISKFDYLDDLLASNVAE